MESALVPIRGGWRRLRHSASFVSLSSLSKAGRESTGEVTPLDWWAVLGIQSLSMISILSSTMVFSTAVFMVREWGAVDEAKAAAHAGLMIAAKPGFSALSSYAWGRRGDTLGFRTTMLFSALVTAVLTAALGAVSSFHWALALRALTGFCDGVMTLTKSAMAKISDRTNSAKAFSTFGVTYGLGSSVGPTIAALLAYPCGGDPNADKEGSPLFSSGCPAHVLRKYPFLLSTAWVGALGLALWTFAFLKMKIPGDGNIPGAAPNARRPEGGDARTPSRAPIGDREVEMASVAEIRGFETEDGAKVRISGRGVLAEDAERGDCLQTVAVTVAESDDSDGEGEDAALLRRPSRDEGTPRSRDSPASVASDAREVNATNETNKKDTWHTDHAVRLATHAQVWCAFIVITGAELTPIWMATSVANGGLGFSAVDIGAFGGVMGIIILVFAATLFSNLANAFGVTTAVRWALTANGIIYLSHPLAWYAERAGQRRVDVDAGGGVCARTRVHGPHRDGRREFDSEQLRAPETPRRGQRVRGGVHQRREGRRARVRGRAHRRDGARREDAHGRRRRRRRPPEKRIRVRRRGGGAADVVAVRAAEHVFLPAVADGGEDAALAGRAQGGGGGVSRRSDA